MDDQSTRRGVQREERRFDQTFLSSDAANSGAHSKLVHRDYAAHFFRWGWVARHLGLGHRILDVGCGPETPLAFLMTRQGQYPDLYVGVDLNQFGRAAGLRRWATILAGEDFVTLDVVLRSRLEDVLKANAPGKGFTDGVCFEVIEHMSPEDGLKLLTNFREYVEDDGRLYLSTPVFDGKRAANHIHEYTIPELQALIEAAGWKVVKRYGTFANIRAIEAVCDVPQAEVMDALKEYYSNEVLSCFLAPLYPDASRNNVWILEKA